MKSLLLLTIAGMEWASSLSSWQFTMSRYACRRERRVYTQISESPMTGMVAKATMADLRQTGRTMYGHKPAKSRLLGESFIEASLSDNLHK